MKVIGNKNNKKTKFFVISLSIMAVVMASIGFTLFGLSDTVSNLSNEISRNSADVILASTDLKNETLVAVPILYYGQKKDDCVDLYDLNSARVLDERQFEWTSCGYFNREVERGIVEPELDSEYLPVAVGGALTSNRGVEGENFKRWFSAVDGKSVGSAKTLDLIYNENEATFLFSDEDFYPVEGSELFTLNLGVPFQVLMNGEEEFEISADDDTWVFIGDRIVLDMGGIHDEMTGRFRIMDNGEVYSAVGDEDLAYSGVKMLGGTSSVIRVFHANRNTPESVFKVSFKNMVLNITNITLARGGEVDGTQVAYDPENPSYIAPLGESLTYKPDRSKAMLTAAVAQASILGALLVVSVVIISVAWRYSLRDHNQG